MKYPIRFLSLLLALMLIFGLIPLAAGAADAFDTAAVGEGEVVGQSDYTYTISGGEATVTGYEGTDTELTIPDLLEGCPVVAIGSEAFAYSAVQSVEIPDSVQTVATRAFYDCASLAQVDFGCGVRSIGIEAFCDCPSLKSVTLPRSLMKIDETALGRFIACGGTDDDPFMSWDVYDGFTIYGYRGTVAEEYCVENGQSFFPGSSNAISFEAVEEDTAPVNTDYWYALDGDEAVIVAYRGASEQITTPTELGGFPVARIADGAFADAESVVVSDGVTSIGRAFGAGLKNIILPDTTAVLDGTFSGCEALTRVVIPAGVTVIGDSAFFGCIGLEKVKIPDSVVSIGDDAFAGCTGLLSVTIPASVTGIGDRAFYECESLAEVAICGGVGAIGEECFRDCVALTAITVPGSVGCIGASAFEGCVSLVSFVIGEGVAAVGDRAAADCDSLMSVTIPASVESIGEDAFGCLYQLEIGENYIEGSDGQEGHYEPYFNESYQPIGGFTVYGMTGSEGESYAGRYEGMIFVALDHQTDESTGVTAALPEGVTLEVEDMTESPEAAEMIAAAYKRLPTEAEVLGVYTVRFTEGGEEFLPDDPVEVRIPKETEGVRVYRVEEDGSLTDLAASESEGYQSFFTAQGCIVLVATRGTGVYASCRGDVDGDGVITVFDATDIQRYLVGLADESFLESAADADGDGVITVFDATDIQRFLVGLPTQGMEIGEPIT